MASTARILVAIVQISYEAKNWTALNDHIVLLSKRRYAISKVVYIFLILPIVLMGPVPRFRPTMNLKKYMFSC